MLVDAVNAEHGDGFSFSPRIFEMIPSIVDDPSILSQVFLCIPPSVYAPLSLYFDGTVHTLKRTSDV